MKEKNIIKNIKRNFGVTRISRLKKYLNRLSAELPIENSEEKSQVKALRKKIQKTFIKMRFFAIGRAFFYIVLYASLISTFLKDISAPEARIIGQFTMPFIILSSIIGTTISLFLIILFTKILNTYWEDARTFATHIIAIHTRNDPLHIATIEKKLLEKKSILKKRKQKNQTKTKSNITTR